MPLTKNNSLKRLAKKATSKRIAELPGFDRDVYVKLNPDIEGSGIDPLEHYVSFGREEGRSISQKNEPWVHVESRALTNSQRENWQHYIHLERGRKSLRKYVLSHPRAWMIESEFSLAGYLMQRKDIAAVVSEPLEAAFHFLEFGLEDGSLGTPTDPDLNFIAEIYGERVVRDLTEETESPTILAKLRKAGHSPLDIALNEAQYCETLGLPGQVFSSLFDHEFYHAIATSRGLPPKDHSRMVCLRHFVETGMDSGLLFHPDLEFESKFYSEILEKFDGEDDPSKMTDEDFYQHWVKKGLRLGLHGSLGISAAETLGATLPAVIFRQLPLYRLASSLAANTTTQEVMEHMRDTPVPGIIALDVSDPEAQDFVTVIGDRLSIRGDVNNAKSAYWHVIAKNPQHSMAAQHLGDLLAREERTSGEITLREKVLTKRTPGWNELLLIDAYLKTYRIHDAIELMEKIADTSFSDVAIANKFQTLADDCFSLIWNNVTSLTEIYEINEVQDLLRRALSCATPSFETPSLPTKISRVALIANVDLYQCKLYRVDQKAEQLREAGYDVTIFPSSGDLSGFVDRADEYDAAIFYRVAAFPNVIQAIAKASQMSLLTFYEIDDVVFDTDHFPPSYQSYAGQITEREYAAMACGVPLFEHAMSLCDYGISSTITIQELMKKKVRSGLVFDHQNALGLLHESAKKLLSKIPRKRDADDRLVLFYGSGTKAHKEDFHTILEPALAEIIRRYPKKIEVQLIGHFGDFEHIDLEKDPVKLIEPIWDFEEFCRLVASADINLSVLDKTLVTDAKSEIKWMEAAYFGVPSVVSATATHREKIEHGVTGFLVETTTDYIKALDDLIKDPDLRTQVADAAKAHVEQNYSLATMGQNLTAVFDGLTGAGNKPKKRVLVVNVFYPPQAIGGATRVVHDNVRDIKEHYSDEFEISVLCTLEGGGNPLEVNTYTQDGVCVWAVTGVPMEDGEMTPQSETMGDVFSTLLDKIKPDLVHFHCIQRLTASVVDRTRLKQIPFILTIHDGWWISPNQFIINDDDGKENYYNFRNLLSSDNDARGVSLYKSLCSADAVLTVSESFAQIHRDIGIDWIEVTENGVSDLPNAAPQPNTSGRVRLAHIGGASRHKGVHHVRNALEASEFENFELLLIDHSMPPGRVKYETWGNTPVTLSGKIPQANVADLYGRIDILLAPSTWPESYGLVTREAMATGTWVIASDIGAIGSDIVAGETGHTIDVTTYEGMLQCLAKIDAAPDSYLKPCAQNHALRTARDQADDIVAVYRRILGNGEMGQISHSRITQKET